jgi:hypothetical protein
LDLLKHDALPWHRQSQALRNRFHFGLAAKPNDPADCIVRYTPKKRQCAPHPAGAVAPAGRLGAIAQAIHRHAQTILYTTPPITGVPLYADARRYAARGIPVVLSTSGAVAAANQIRRVVETSLER